MNKKLDVNLKNSPILESKLVCKNKKDDVSSTKKSVNKNRNTVERKQLSNGLKCLKTVQKSRTPHKLELNKVQEDTPSSRIKQISGKKCKKFYFDTSPENVNNKKLSPGGIKMELKSNFKEGVKEKESRRLTEENDRQIKVYPDSDDSSYCDYIQLCGSPAAVVETSKEQKSMESKHWFEEEDEIMLLQG